jgi:hypothetical protein
MSMAQATADDCRGDPAGRPIFAIRASSCVRSVARACGVRVRRCLVSECRTSSVRHTERAAALRVSFGLAGFVQLLIKGSIVGVCIVAVRRRSG